MKQTVNNLAAILVTSFLDFSQLRLGFLACVFFDLLVSTRVLLGKRFVSEPRFIYDKTMWVKRPVSTSASNFLNSSSFCCRYSSISLCASDLASFIRFVRSKIVLDDWSLPDQPGEGTSVTYILVLYANATG